MFNFLQKKRVESALESHKREKIFLNFESIKRVLIIFNIEDWDNVSNVINDLQKNKKEVVAWTIRPKKFHIEESDYPPIVRIINGAKETTWKHALTENVVSEFEELKYDTLIDLTIDDNNILNYLLACNTSRFCIGIRESDMNAYDFIMLKKEENDILETYEQMKSYLNSNIK